MPTVPADWSVDARNLPEHAGNTIHTDAGARAAGFPAALVAGVTTYAYLTHPLVAAWGIDWVARGGGEVRFRAPVFADDRVDCVVTDAADDADDGDGGDGGDDEGVTVDAVCPAQEPNPRVTFRAVRDAGPPPPVRGGESLPSYRLDLAARFGTDYGRRAGDDLELYELAGVAHPALWPAIANDVFTRELVQGPWIHTRSVIRHHDTCPADATVDVHAVVVDRFDRHGHRAVVDVRIEFGDRTIATLEHEAIVELPPG